MNRFDMQLDINILHLSQFITWPDKSNRQEHHDSACGCRTRTVLAKNKGPDWKLNQ